MKQRGISLVVGADGLIGRALAEHLESAGESVVETTRRIDTTSERRVFLNLMEDVSDWHPLCQVSVAYLCAAASSLDYCRKHPIQSATVNVTNTVVLAKALTASGTFVIFPSTNLVYDGSIPFRKADDSVCPVTVYGWQKAETEKQLLALGNLVSVVRFTKILGPEMSLLKEWIRLLRNNEPVRAFSDMVMAPVSLSFVVDVLRRIAEACSSGIIQVSGDKDVTYEQVVRHLAHRVGASQDLIRPIRSREGDLQLEAIPSCTTLDTTRLHTEFGIEPPDVWTTIDSVFGL